MRRRAVLSCVAALLGGCLSAATPGVRTDPPAPDRLPPTGDGAVFEFDDDDPFRRRTVGEPADGAGHRIVVRNDDADRRRIGVRLREPGAADPAVDARPTFPAYGSFRVGVYRPADYVLDVVSPNGRRRTFGVPREFLDCDDSATYVAVRPDGSVRAGVASAVPGCDAEPAPES